MEGIQKKVTDGIQKKVYGQNVEKRLRAKFRLTDELSDNMTT